MKEFAELFSSKRVQKGLSQKEIAAMLNVTRQAVSKWERGFAMPDIALMPKIAEILDVSLDQLLTGNEPKKEIVEKEIIVEKEVVKKPSIKRICAIVAPIMIICIVAAALMGVYIPKAIAAAKPPVEQEQPPEPPKPEPTYIDIGIDGENNEYGSPEVSREIEYDEDGKAYYNFVAQFTSDFFIRINTHSVATVFIGGERITGKIYNGALYDPTYGVLADDYFEKSVYLRQGEQLKIAIDDSSINEYGSPHGLYNIKPKMDFDNITIPANSEYWVALRREEFCVERYQIKNENIKFTGLKRQKEMDRYHSIYYYDDTFSSFDDISIENPKIILDLAMPSQPSGSYRYENDYHFIVLSNLSNNEEVLQIEKSNIDSIQLNTEYQLHLEEYEYKFFILEVTGLSECMPFVIDFNTDNGSSWSTSIMVYDSLGKKCNMIQYPNRRVVVMDNGKYFIRVMGHGEEVFSYQITR